MTPLPRPLPATKTPTSTTPANKVNEPISGDKTTARCRAGRQSISSHQNYARGLGGTARSFALLLLSVVVAVVVVFVALLLLLFLFFSVFYCFVGSGVDVLVVFVVFVVWLFFPVLVLVLVLVFLLSFLFLFLFLFLLFCCYSIAIIQRGVTTAIYTPHACKSQTRFRRQDKTEGAMAAADRLLALSLVSSSLKRLCSAFYAVKNACKCSYNCCVCHPTMCSMSFNLDHS